MSASFFSKKIISSMIVSIGLISMLVQVVSADEAGDFANAKQKGTLEGWQSFLDKYPKGQKINDARQAFDTLLYEKAKAAGRPEELEAFFRRANPTGPWTRRAEHTPTRFSLYMMKPVGTRQRFRIPTKGTGAISCIFQGENILKKPNQVLKSYPGSAASKKENGRRMKST